MRSLMMLFAGSGNLGTDVATEGCAAGSAMCGDCPGLVKEQDVQVDEHGKASLLKGIAKDRRISVEDGQMRHGRKCRSVRVDGYKHHVLHDLDTDLICAVGITPANAPEASVTEAISEDLKQREVCLKELHIDRA